MNTPAQNRARSPARRLWVRGVVTQALARILAVLWVAFGATHRQRRLPDTGKMTLSPPSVVLPSDLPPGAGPPPAPVVDPADPLSVAEAKQQELSWSTRLLELELEAQRR